MSDFFFYLRCNHELVGLFAVPDSHPTDRPTRVVLLYFSFCFGLMFEVAIGEIMGEDTNAFVVGLILGIVLSFMFSFMEQWFTCAFLRKKMDEDSLNRMEGNASQLTKDQKMMRETGFGLFRVFFGSCMCCFYTPGALGCFFGAVAIVANKRNLAYGDAIPVTIQIWCVGYLSGQIYSLFWCAMRFYYRITYKEEKFVKWSKDAKGADADMVENALGMMG